MAFFLQQIRKGKVYYESKNQKRTSSYCCYGSIAFSFIASGFRKICSSRCSQNFYYSTYLHKYNRKKSIRKLNYDLHYSVPDKRYCYKAFRSPIGFYIYWSQY
ncbi:MAG: hypothetical protein E7306_04320 [Butyrivibrio sp.]|nr:hypothetical protein [Butyrivibrio sp.]